MEKTKRPPPLPPPTPPTSSTMYTCPVRYRQLLQACSYGCGCNLLQLEIFTHLLGFVAGKAVSYYTYIPLFHDLCSTNLFMLGLTYSVCMNNQINYNFLNKKGWPKCYAKSPTVQGAFWLIPGLNSQPVKYRGLESPQESGMCFMHSLVKFSRVIAVKCVWMGQYHSFWSHDWTAASCYCS